jgi:hypothetical protein
MPPVAEVLNVARYVVSAPAPVVGDAFVAVRLDRECAATTLYAGDVTFVVSDVVLTVSLYVVFGALGFVTPSMWRVTLSPPATVEPLYT